MTQADHYLEWKQMVASAGPYPVEAFIFVREGLNYATQQVYGDPDAMPEFDRHVSGQQLCLGLRDYAINRYGLLAPVVLEHWKIRRTDDFGRIVFSMIEAGLMTQTSDDRLEDFRAVYDFDEAFCQEELLSQID